MSRTFTAADRSALIRLASTLPVGSKERKAILRGLVKVEAKTAKTAMAFKLPHFPIKGKGDKVVVMKPFEAGTEPYAGGMVQGRKIKMRPGSVPNGFVIDMIKGYKSNPSSAMMDQLGPAAWQNDEPDQYLINFGGMKVYVTEDDWRDKKVMAVPPPKEWSTSLLKASQDDLMEVLREEMGVANDYSSRTLWLHNPKEVAKKWDEAHGRGAWGKLLVDNLVRQLGGEFEADVMKFIREEARSM